MIRLISARQATRKERRRYGETPLNDGAGWNNWHSEPTPRSTFPQIPPLEEKFWQNAVRNPYYRPVKQQLTVRLDADLVAWLRRDGKGYQTRLNRMLREAMLEEMGKRS